MTQHVGRVDDRENRRYEEIKAPERADKKVTHCFESKNIVELIKYLKDHAGKVSDLIATVSQDVADEIGPETLRSNYWHTDDPKLHLLQLVQKNDYMGALIFIKNSQKNILKNWIEDCFEKKDFQNASRILRDFYFAGMGVDPNDDEFDVDSFVNDEPDSLPHMYERILQLVSTGNYLMASKLCDQLQTDFGGKVNESLESVNKRHAAELLEDMPENSTEMKKVFGNLPQLLKLIDQLEKKGVHLYIKRNSAESKLYLLSNGQFKQDKDIYVRVNSKQLWPNDIINDENFVKEGQSNYRLASNVITITDEKAQEFRSAA